MHGTSSFLSRKNVWAVELDQGAAKHVAVSLKCMKKSTIIAYDAPAGP
jgi:hypothetical protein